MASPFPSSCQCTPAVIKRIENDYLPLRLDFDSFKILNHENIVKIIHYEEDEQFRYMTTEWFVATLYDYYQEGYQGPVLSVRESMIQLANGLHYMHSKQLIHCDMKPHNIFISAPSSSGKVTLKIGDIMCYRTIAQERSYWQSHTSWLAPEILRLVQAEQEIAEDYGKMYRVATQASDIFSLGCAFYYLLTKGKHPFGQDKMKWIILIQKSIITDLPDSPLGSLIKRMLKFMADARPSAEEICRLFQSGRDVQDNDASCIREGETTQLLASNRPALPVKSEVSTFLVSRNGHDNESRRVCQSSWNSNGLMACCTEDGRVLLFNESNHSKMSFRELISETNSMKCLDWDSSGSFLAIGSANRIYVYNILNNTVNKLESHLRAIKIIKWNQKSYPTLLISADWDKKVIVWNGIARNVIQQFSFPEPINDVNWMSHDTFLVASGRKTLVMQIFSDKPLQTYSHEETVWRVASHPLGHWIATASKDNKLNVWWLDGQLLIRQVVSNLQGLVNSISWFYENETNSEQWLAW